MLGRSDSWNGRAALAPGAGCLAQLEDYNRLGAKGQELIAEADKAGESRIGLTGLPVISSQKVTPKHKLRPHDSYTPMHKYKTLQFVAALALAGPATLLHNCVEAEATVADRQHS